MKKMMVAGIASLAAVPLMAGLYGDTPDAKHAWAVHDWNRPKPAKVEVDAKGVPSDAIVLFDGTKESFEKNWQSDKGGAPTWKCENGMFSSKEGWGLGSVRTKAEFGDCQLHIEYMHPADTKSLGGPQMRGNSGVFLMGPQYGYEVQVLESYYTSREMDGKEGFVDNYTDGQAGAVYAENPPMVNPQRKPGEWQVYDIVFHQPVWEGDKLLHPGSITVFFNGVLVQDHWEMEGQTTHCRRRPLMPHPKKGPLSLQDHGCPVNYRNIWIREIPSRWDNKTHSAMSADTAEVMKLRGETAERLFAKVDMSQPDSAKTVQDLLEVVSYSKDAKYMDALKKSCDAFKARIEGLDDSALNKAKGEVTGVNKALEVLRRNNVFEKDCDFCTFVKDLCQKKGWK